MIEIRIAVSENGILKSLRAEGHSLSAPKGSNIVCSAVSVLLGSSLRALKSGGNCSPDIKNEQDGFLEFSVDTETQHNGRIGGITDMLLAGLLEIERDYPGECRIELIKSSNRS